MMIFTRFARSSRSASSLALAFALASGVALTATAIEAPAHAQKKKKSDAPEYSKGFVEAYTPIREKIQGETPDPAGAKPLVPALVASAQSGPEKLAAGQIIANLGGKIDDQSLTLQGYELMVASGATEPNTTGTLNQLLFQMYRDRGEFAKARASLEKNIAANFSSESAMSDGTTRTLGPDDYALMIAEMYFGEQQYDEGFAYLNGLVDARRAAGQEVPERWLRRAFTVAYENERQKEALGYISGLAETNPSPEIWNDAIELTLYFNEYANADALDLLRLSRRMEQYKNSQMLLEYVELLDARRFPGEVTAVIDEGWNWGTVDRSDRYLVESRKEAASRLDADRRDLPKLAADARASGADLQTVVVAGDTFLSYDQPAEAEEFYTKALTKSGVETPMVLTRLGIAQYDQGKYAEAIETFRKVDGARRDIANLWAIYASQQTGG